MFLAFWSLYCIRVNLGCNLRPGFVSKIRGNGENQESSEQGPPSTKAPRAPPALHSHWIPGIIPALLHRFASRTGYPTGGSRCGLLQAPFTPFSVLLQHGWGWEERESSLGQSDQPLCVPGVQAPNHGQGWSPKRPEEFLTSSRNTKPAPPAPPLLSCSLDFPWTLRKSWIPKEQHKKRGFKRTWEVPPFASPPNGAAEQTWRSFFKDIPKSKYLKC